MNSTTRRTNMMTQPIIHLLSGGMDSVTLLYELTLPEKHLKVHALMFDYGQNHWKELDYARWHCKNLDVPWSKVDIQRVFQGKLLSSRLVGGPGPSDVVHNRNAVMLSIACSIAASSKTQMVSYACNKDDAEMFPDCRVEFVDVMNEANKRAGIDVEIVTPFIGWTKKEIVKRGRELAVDFDKVWSCYIGGANPCHQCNACKLRDEAMK